MGYALFRMLGYADLMPDAVFGHSLGELVAAAASGAIELKQAVKLVAARGRLMQASSDGGRMAVVYANQDAVNELLVGYEKTLDIAAINAPEMIVVSGFGAALEKFLARATERGIRHTVMKVNRAFHSPLMEPILGVFERVAGEISYGSPQIPIISSMTGEVVESYDATYWRNHLRRPTQFLKAMKTLESLGYETLVELGPHPTLINMARSFLEAGKIDLLGTLNRRETNLATLYQTLGALHLKDYPLPLLMSSEPVVRQGEIFP